MSKLMKCPTCGQSISSAAESCPHCGEPLSQPSGKKGKYRWLLTGFGVLFMIFGILTIAKGIEMMNLAGESSISTGYTTPAAILLCVGLFCAVAPWCKKK